MRPRRGGRKVCVRYTARKDVFGIFSGEGIGYAEQTNLLGWLESVVMWGLTRSGEETADASRIDRKVRGVGSARGPHPAASRLSSPKTTWERDLGRFAPAAFLSNRALVLVP